MLSSVTLLCTLTLGGAPAVESIFVPAAPLPVGGKWTPTPNQTCAVVLIHGFHYQLLEKSVPKAELRPWQQPDSLLVKELAKNADVFTFAYGQNASLDTIVKESTIGTNVTQLRKFGYQDIVLLGHSAGGLIARHFVEDNPNAGVTKVIQVCSPNGGSPLATLTGPKGQKAFRDCLTEKGRLECLRIRSDKLIPEHIHFVCVMAMGNGSSGSDGVVPCACQWTADLQKQGIPVVVMPLSHRAAIRDAKAAETLANLVRERPARWPAERIEKARKELFK